MVVLHVVGFVEDPGKDGAAGNGGGDRGGQPREQERHCEHHRRMVAEKRRQKALRLGQFFHHGPVPEKGGRRQQDHGAVDGPADEHAEQGVEKFVIELLFDHCVVFQVPLAALDDLAVEKEVVGHDHGPEHAHHDDDAPLGQAGPHPGDSGLDPIDVHQGQFVEKGEPDDRDKADDDLLHHPVGVGEQHQRNKEDHQESSGRQRDVEQHLEGNGPAEDFGKGGGNRGEHRRSEHRPADPGGRVLIGGLGQTQPGDDPQMGDIVLEHDQHQGGEGDHPQQRVAVTGPGGDVGGPVTRIDETDRDQQTRPNVAENLEGAEGRFVIRTAEILEELGYIHSLFSFPCENGSQKLAACVSPNPWKPACHGSRTRLS